jgi:succinate dehydrogenase / fumarate reductase cytochrome b subunit
MKRLGIEWVEITKAACTGAGVLQEKDQKLGDTLNVRTFALAEKMGLTTIMVICSTCQGVMSQANARVKRDAEYMKEINGFLKDEGLEYKGTVQVKHMLWALIEDIGLEKLKQSFQHELVGLKVAPFYGCYIVRPSDVLGFGENPQRQTSLETVITATGAKVVDFSGKNKCCGLPILYINQQNALRMVSNHTGTAQDAGADAMVTPCPLCHLNLDGYQPKARRRNRSGDSGTLPILHLPQLLGLAMGIAPKELGLQHHMVNTSGLIRKAAPRAVGAPQ